MESVYPFDWYWRIAIFILGTLSHHILWIRYEWDGIVWAILAAIILLHQLLVLPLYYYELSLGAGIGFLAQLDLLYLIGLFGSIVVYRIFDHPLRHFPGPFWAKVWVWWRVEASLASGDRHAVVLEDLHNQNGDIVRIGPNLLSIRSAASIPVIHGAGSKFLKSAAYENPMGACINWDRNPRSHHLRRAKWDKALNSSACHDYAPRIVALTNMLVQRLKETQGNATSVNRWTHLFAFDVMGDLCFGRSYQQLHTGETHPMVRIILKYMRIGVYATMVPWLHCIISRLPAPWIEKPDWLFRAFAESELMRRKTEGEKLGSPDIMSHLLRPTGKRALTFEELVLDTLIMQVGGSDTTSSALFHVLYRLARHPLVQGNLYQELTSVLPQGGQTVWNDHLRLPYLDAVLSETMRLHPPAATGFPRMVPAGGVQIDGFHIPGSSTVLSPTFAIQRDERFFRDALAFFPERWTEEKATMVRDARAFCPFGIGAYGCAGRHLAMMEMRIVVASIIRTFEVKLPQGADENEVCRRVEGEWKDCLTTQAAKLELRFIARG